MNNMIEVNSFSMYKRVTPRKTEPAQENPQTPADIGNAIKNGGFEADGDKSAPAAEKDGYGLFASGTMRIFWEGREKHERLSREIEKKYGTGKKGD